MIYPLHSSTQWTEWSGFQPWGRENTLEEVLSHMEFLHEHFTETKSKRPRSPCFHARFYVAWLKFEKYYQITEQAPVYVAVILLHPALRKTYLSEQWKRNTTWVDDAVKAVRNIWLAEYKDHALPEMQQAKEEPVDAFDDWRRNVYSTASESRDEFDSFINVSKISPRRYAQLTILDRGRS